MINIKPIFFLISSRWNGHLMKCAELLRRLAQEHHSEAWQTSSKDKIMTEPKHGLLRKPLKILNTLATMMLVCYDWQTICIYL